MPYDRERHHRRSIRRKGYNYSLAGAYFATVCVQDRVCALGEIVAGEMRPNSAGEIVAETWNGLLERFLTIDLDAFVVMPNHVHCVVLVGARPNAPEADDSAGPSPIATAEDTSDRPAGWPGAMNPTLGEIVRAFKAVSTRLIRTTVDPSFAWHRNYYERIVRDDHELNRIRTYIANNPATWHRDDENPALVQGSS